LWIVLRSPAFRFSLTVSIIVISRVGVGFALVASHG